MEHIYQWMRNIAFYLVLVVVVMQLVPGEEYKKYIKFFTGLIFLLMLMQPITSIFGITKKQTVEYEKEREKIEAIMEQWEEKYGE